MFDVFLGFAFLASATVANKYALSVLSLFINGWFAHVRCRIILYDLLSSKNTSPYIYLFQTRSFSTDWHIALLTMLVPALFKAYALKNMLTSKAAFIASLDPFVTALYSYFFWNERFN